MNAILNQYKRYMGAISYAAFILLIFTLPLPWSFTQPVCVAWLVLWLLEGNWLQKSNWQFGKGMIPMALITIFIGWHALSLLWSSNVQQGIADINKYIIFLAAPLVGLIGVNSYYKPIQIKTTLMAACLISIVAYCLVMLSFYRTRIWVPGVTPYYLIDGWNLFGEPPIHALKHRHYYCLTLTLALFFSGDLYQHFRLRYTPLSAFLTIGIADLILMAAVVLTGSRTMILLLPVLIMLMIIRYLRGRQLAMAIGGEVIALILVGWFFLHHNTRVINTIQDNQQLNFEKIQQQPLAHEPRLYLHGTILHNYRAYGWKGLGIGTSKDFMMQCYEKDQLPEMINVAYGPHSQYLNTWIELGPIALLLMLFILGFAPFCYHGRTRWDAIGIVTIFGWAMLTETCLSRINGLYIFTAILILLMVENRQQHTNKPIIEPS